MGKTKNVRSDDTQKTTYWADVIAWVVDDDGDGEEIARYYKSLGYLDNMHRCIDIYIYKLCENRPSRF